MSDRLNETARRLRTGEETARSYIESVCGRIEACEDEVQALLPETGRRERLLAEAARLQAAYPQADPPADVERDLAVRGWKALARPPLYGVAVAVKDIYRVDGFPTRAGSRLPPELFEGREAPIVTRLREAGALILGKAVTTEFAYFQPGPTRNPRNPVNTPGGSSSGSAAAVAAGYCPLALGSQTVGSVIRPAAFCGVAGFKFSYGRVSLEAVVPYAPSLDHVGFFVPRAEDLPYAVSVLLDEPPYRYWPECPSFGVPGGPYLEQAAKEAVALLQASADRLSRDEGWDLYRGGESMLPDITEINEANRRLTAAEMALTHAEWFRRYESLYSPRTAAHIREGLTIPPSELASLRESRLELRERIEDEMVQAGIRAWVCPSAVGTAPRGLESTGDPCMNLPWTHAGLPVATVPAGRGANGLPLGLQCVGLFGDDAWLAEFAAHVGAALRDERDDSEAGT